MLNNVLDFTKLSAIMYTHILFNLVYMNALDLIRLASTMSQDDVKKLITELEPVISKTQEYQDMVFWDNPAPSSFLSDEDRDALADEDETEPFVESPEFNRE